MSLEKFSFWCHPGDMDQLGFEPGQSHPCPSYIHRNIFIVKASASLVCKKSPIAEKLTGKSPLIFVMINFLSRTKDVYKLLLNVSGYDKKSNPQITPKSTLSAPIPPYFHLDLIFFFFIKSKINTSICPFFASFTLSTRVKGETEP